MEFYRVKTGSILPLGKQGENLARQIQFDLSRWISNFGPGTVQLLHQRSSDEAPYPVAVEQEGNLAVWTVTSADTAAAGTGRAELQYYVGDALAKSETWMTKVFPALGPAAETPPEAQQGWVDQVLAQVARITGMTAQAVELPAGSAPTADYADGVLTIGIPLGGDVSEAQIAQAVAEYLAKNPIAETDPTVPDWAKQPEKPSYTADEVGAMSSETLPEAINTALAQAKESGEFDGAAGQDGAPGQDGITPTIGDNGNWYLGDTDTGKPSRGETGQAGADGRDGADGQPGADGKSAYQYAVEGGYTGTEEAFAAKLSKEMPDKLPNPNALTFTGAVSGSYDGSAPLEVAIPSGGGGLTVTNTAAVGQTVKITAVDENGQPTEWEAVDMAGATAVTPELLYSGTAENVTSFQQDIDFKGHRNLVIVVSGTKGEAAISMEEGSLYMDGNRFVFAYYSSFLSAASESAPNGCVVYTIFMIGSDRCRVDFSQFVNYGAPFWEYLQASSSTQSSAKTCYLKSAASTAYEKIGINFSASVPAVDVEVYGF